MIRFINKTILWVKKENQKARVFDAGASKKRIVNPNAINPFINKIIK